MTSPKGHIKLRNYIGNLIGHSHFLTFKLRSFSQVIDTKPFGVKAVGPKVLVLAVKDNENERSHQGYTPGVGAARGESTHPYKEYFLTTSPLPDSNESMTDK